MSDYRRAAERYRAYNRQARELIEEEAFHSFHLRVDVVSIDEDILRKAKRDWYPSPNRHVSWDWEAEIIEPLFGYGVRTFSAAYVYKGQLCALVAARVSPAKQWISLTYIEGCPDQHPLKGGVIALGMRSLYVYRGVISVNHPPECVGIRVLRPTPDALHCYQESGYTEFQSRKRDSALVFEQPRRRDP